MTSPADITARLDHLETHIAHQNSVIDELSDVSIRQWAEIRALTERLSHLQHKLQELERGIDTPRDEGEEPPPPHY